MCLCDSARYENRRIALTLIRLSKGAKVNNNVNENGCTTLYADYYYYYR